MFADYHVHSEFSDDSNEPIEKEVQRAIEIGLEEICFTDHFDYRIKREWNDSCGMPRCGNGSIRPSDNRMVLSTNVDYPNYFCMIRMLQEKYKDQIQIKAGLEFGVQTGTIQDYEKLYWKYNDRIDFILLSVHQKDNLGKRQTTRLGELVFYETL